MTNLDLLKGLSQIEVDGILDVLSFEFDTILGECNSMDEYFEAVSTHCSKRIKELLVARSVPANDDTTSSGFDEQHEDERQAYLRDVASFPI